MHVYTLALGYTRILTYTYTRTAEGREALVSLVQDAVTDARTLHALLNAGHSWRQTAAAVYNTGSVGTPAG